MKVKELISLLEELRPDSEININLRHNFRPAGMKPIGSITPAIDMDTNKIKYSIDVNLGDKSNHSEEDDLLVKE